MLLSYILDTKIVDNKAELDGVGDVFPEIGSVGGLIISVGRQFLLPYILDTKIVDNKAELEGVGDVFPEIGSVGGLIISVGRQFLLQIFI